MYCDTKAVVGIIVTIALINSVAIGITESTCQQTLINSIIKGANSNSVIGTILKKWLDNLRDGVKNSIDSLRDTCIDVNTLIEPPTTEQPTELPTQLPTEQPTEPSTEQPSEVPTNPPTESPIAPLPTSCTEVTAFQPDSTTGYYNISTVNGVTRVFCNMDLRLGESWMRVAHLNMSNPSEQCPPGFKLYEQDSARACGRNHSGCQSVEFPSYGIEYTHIIGKVLGYQKGSTDAFYANEKTIVSIDKPYVDGVVLTHGRPRHHVWTFASSLLDNFNVKIDACPCYPAAKEYINVPPFISNDYFCESGIAGRKWDHSTFHTNDPLWDGKQCGRAEMECCETDDIPWFHKEVGVNTNDNLELRVCCDEDIYNEDTPVEFYEIYIK